MAKNTIGGIVGPIAIGPIPRTPIQLMNISNSVIGRIYDPGPIAIGPRSQIRHLSINTTLDC